MYHNKRTQADGGFSVRRALLSILTLLVLTGLMFYIFKDHLPEISAALARLRPHQTVLLLALGLTYPLIEGVISQRILSTRLPGYPFRRGLDLAFLGAFGNVVTFGAGTMPMQGYDISLQGLGIGPGIGLVTLQYVFHKGAVLLTAAILLVFQLGWLLSADTAGLMQYLLPACLMVGAIILVLVLVCTSQTVQSLAYRLLNLLPNTSSWQARRQSWTAQLDGLRVESRHLLQNRGLCLLILGLQLCKLLIMYAIPWFGARFMGLGELTFWQAETLTALMMLLSNALPNLGGMGSIETAFYLIFTGFLGDSGAMSLLVVYRAATYYAPFAASCVGFFLIQRRWTRTRRTS